MSSIDFDGARAFIGAIPVGRGSAYKDIASAGGNKRGAQAVGNWLRREGYSIKLDHRVLTVDGRMPETFRSAGADAPADPEGLRARLRSEGVVIDGHARAAQRQRFSATDWAP